MLEPLKRALRCSQKSVIRHERFKTILDLLFNDKTRFYLFFTDKSIQYGVALVLLEFNLTSPHLI